VIESLAEADLRIVHRAFDPLGDQKKGQLGGIWAKVSKEQLQKKQWKNFMMLSLNPMA
jgi:hypothetical protein